MSKLTDLTTRVPLAQNTVNGKENRCDSSQNLSECLQDKLRVSARIAAAIEPPKMEPGDPLAVNSSEPNGQKGVFVRPPLPGQLIVCKGEAGDCLPSKTEFLLRSAIEPIPQLGYLLFLPFSNKTFQNNTIALSLRANGSVEKFEYKTLKAAAEVGAGTAADLVGQVSGFLSARDKMRLDEEAAQKAEIVAGREEQVAQIQHQIDLLTKEQELEKLSTQESDELTTTQTATAQVQARVALLEALLAEKRAKIALEM